MRRALASAFGFAAGAALTLGAGCTFLVSFDDVPDEAGPDGVAPSTRDADAADRRDSGADAGQPASDTCDDDFPLAEVGGCVSFKDNAQVCADHELITYPAGRDASADLVTCTKDRGAICVKHCAGPGGCAHMPDGVPDQCDRCATKRDGTYCGSEMPGWSRDTYPLLVTCTAGRMSARSPCPGGCEPGQGAARCL